jgi:uncharacterized membrane protein
MHEHPAGVLIAGEQESETAQDSFRRLLAQVSQGNLKGVVYEENDEPPRPEGPSHVVRRGAIKGAVGGLVLGLIPLIASTLVGATAGAVIGRFSELRIEQGRVPRVHFVKRAA